MTTTTTLTTAAPGFAPAALTERIREKSLLVGALLTEIRKVIVGQGSLVDRLTIGLLADGDLLFAGVPGLASTLAWGARARREAPRARPRRVPLAHPVPARPAPGRPHRHARLQPEDAGVRRAPRPGVRESRSRRRDQPRARQGPVRAPRGDAGAAGHGRRHDDPATRPVSRPRDAE